MQSGSYVRRVDAAVRGRGVALGIPALLCAELAAGRLVALDRWRLTTGRRYHLVAPSERMPSAALAALEAWPLCRRAG